MKKVLVGIVAGLFLLFGVFVQVKAQLNDEQRKSFVGVKVIRLVVDIDYGTAKPQDLPFGEPAEILLKASGFKVVARGAKSFDATLIIKGIGRALGAKYHGGGYFYTGAELIGDISLQVVGGPVYEKHFAGKRDPESRTVRSNTEPRRAPFMETYLYNSNYHSELVKMIGDLYGYRIYLVALKVKDYDDHRLGEDVVVRVRMAAAEALGNLGDSCAVEPLIGAFKNRDVYWVRVAAVEALGKIGDLRAVKPLCDALKDRDSYVVTAAAEALGKIGDSQAVEPLIAVLKLQNYENRKTAAEALGKIGDSRAVEPLRTALKDLRDDNSTLGKVIKKALKALENK